MTETPQAPAEKPTPDPPHSPKPSNLLAAVILAVVCIWNITIDGQAGDYEGSKVTYGLVIGICMVLGYDLSRFWPGGRK